MNPALLDTDTLSLLLRQDPAVTERARGYLQEHHHLTFSIITRYEILRGLEAREASAQLERFHVFCAACAVLPVDDATVVSAARLYGGLHRAGTLIGDADILIAATALTRDLVLVTNNERHLRRIPGLRTENWWRA